MERIIEEKAEIGYNTGIRRQAKDKRPNQQTGEITHEHYKGGTEKEDDPVAGAGRGGRDGRDGGTGGCAEAVSRI